MEFIKTIRDAYNELPDTQKMYVHLAVGFVFGAIIF